MGRRSINDSLNDDAGEESAMLTAGPLNRESLTTACAFAAAGVLVCGCVAPSMESRSVRSEVRVVQLASRSATVADPLGGLAESLPDAVGVDADVVAAALRLPTVDPADVSAAVPPVLASLSTDEITEVTEASVGGPMIATRLISLLLQPLVWLVQVLPDPLKPIAGGFLFMATFVGGVVGAAIDAVVDPILRLFGFGALAAAPLAAVEAVAGDPAADDSVVVAAEPENATSQTITVVDAESTEVTGGVEVAGLDETEDASTQSESPLQEEVPSDAVHSADDLTESGLTDLDSTEIDISDDQADAQAAQQESEVTAGDDGSSEAGRAAEDSTPSPEPSGDVADS
ncbi:hypothetical protein JN086_25465 [Mycolicibacterium austroafricanum]|uniref:hypothetical protein n=1 Tax=Mycolicibacterium austroafricanum TaxID=39687 RepID=UPI001ABEFD53|nr:hypothetical protein [Mycolicibacterium austroafricanum]QRZ06305.1 hypothetical protein JN090_25990 [Mycolicibacterium austroafricanum]QZT67780.1 hypothetical protein JN086_25465 [Mycolicibacterium austroafricanum]